MAEQALPNDAITLSAEASAPVCHGCGYNLQGLPRDGRCPECHAPAWVAAAGDALQFADPSWVRALVGGARLILLGYVALWVAPLLGAGVLSLLSVDQRLVGALGLCGGACLASIVMACGMWRFSTPEPGVVERGMSARRWIRVGVVSCAATLSLLGPVYWGPLGNGAWYALNILGSPLGLTGMLGLFGYARWVEQLARRTHDPAAEIAARRYWQMYAIAWVVTLLGALLGIRAPAANCVSLIGGSLLLISGSLIMILPHRILSGVREAMSRSKQHWATAGPLAREPQRTP